MSGHSSKLCNYGAEFALERGQGLQLEEKPLNFRLLLLWNFFFFLSGGAVTVSANLALLSAKEM